VIDFRYHLVSIIAVFLALAVGLLVGSAYLSGPEETLLQTAQNALTKRNDSLSASNAALTHQVAADQAFARAMSPLALDGLLSGQKVVLVEAPNASSQMTSGVMAALQQAGATVTGQVLLQPAFFSDGGQNESTLTQLAQQLAPQVSVTLPTNPSYQAVAGQEAAAAVISASIVSKTGLDLTGSASQTVLAGFAQDGFLQVQPAPGAASLDAATAAILLTPAGTQPSATSEALVAFAAQLRSASLGTVMAGSLSGNVPGSPISLEGNSGPVSTVDNADTESGQIMVAQALRKLLDGQSAQAYGVGPGTAVSPAPTAPATTSVTPKGKRT
jgi:Copper transport outer membrane protein, MctB